MQGNGLGASDFPLSEVDKYVKYLESMANTAGWVKCKFAGLKKISDCNIDWENQKICFLWIWGNSACTLLHLIAEEVTPVCAFLLTAQGLVEDINDMLSISASFGGHSGSQSVIHMLPEHGEILDGDCDLTAKLTDLF
ncbi:hypothetical protein P691DRAFT_768356 [Macrolepiota fuliginosa MF-IS2]|uniref:Uncharacterized protein n=1 Tax=Macrolepiota fuliginosa MF-IS2 TaxID=1400762 RepID=A0A9P5WZA3_9AGAR|nr:hypothetical protein P691DRAFT_768356 [Macrolepiota fuliginosa MF-IS2]